MSKLILALALSMPLQIFAQSPYISPYLENQIQSRISSGLSTGIIIGTIDETGPQYYGYGEVSKGSGLTPNKDTVYKLASVTKTFTAIALADYLLREEVSLDSPVKDLFNEPIVLPEKNAKPITLKSLVNHTSGLPKQPSDWANVALYNYPPIYTEADLLNFLSKYKPRNEVGSAVRYSNTAFGLLGMALSSSTGSSYESIVQARIIEPLGMTNTKINLTPSMSERLAPPRNNIISLLDGMGALEAAASLNSTAEDMLKYLAANIGLTEAPAFSAMEYSHQPLGSYREGQIGMAWFIEGEGENKIYAHGGTIPGYQTFVGFSKLKKIGVVVLASSSPVVGDIGRYILNPSTSHFGN